MSEITSFIQQWQWEDLRKTRQILQYKAMVIPKQPYLHFLQRTGWSWVTAISVYLCNVQKEVICLPMVILWHAWMQCDTKMYSEANFGVVFYKPMQWPNIPWWRNGWCLGKNDEQEFCGFCKSCHEVLVTGDSIWHVRELYLWNMDQNSITELF